MKKIINDIGYQEKGLAFKMSMLDIMYRLFYGEPNYVKTLDSFLTDSITGTDETS